MSVTENVPAEATTAATAERAMLLRGNRSLPGRRLAGGALGMADQLIHAELDLLRHAVSSMVVVDVEVNVDVDVASRATRANEGARPAPARD